MRPFQLLQSLRPSQFWSTPETAGPTTWDVFRFWDHVRPLWPQGRSRPPPFGSWAAPTRVGPADVPALTQFWTEHYNGTDWVFRPEPEWVASILASNTFALIVRDGGEIVGSIVCRGIAGAEGRFCLGALELQNAYMIEGLCIHPRWRGQHLAGWLIAWVDHLANATAPQAFFWSREAPPRDPTYVASHTYAYLPVTATITPRRLEETALTAIPWDTFRRIWASYVPRWGTDAAAFPTQLPADPLRVWRWRNEAMYIVVSDTRRWTRDAQPRKIWEVQFCGDLYAPWETNAAAKDVLEAVGSLLAAEGAGLLFVSSAPWQGGCTNWPGWVVGTAGYHTTYIYNYMPPVFHRLATLFLRNEL